jgi:hypothetical protein
MIANKSKNQFIILKIHDMKKENDKTLYLTEWEGYPSKNDFTWEPYKHLNHTTIFQDYVKYSGLKRKKEDTGILVKDIFKKNKRESLTKDERFELIRCQNYKCNLCLNPFGSSYFEIDHIVPLEQGGTNDLINLQGLCDSCHIFKTTVLDRGVIARLLQAKLQHTKVSGKNDLSFTRKEILEECQMIYFSRNMNKLPFHQDEIFNFCISTVDIYREMCKKEVKNRINNIIESKIDITNITESKIDITNIIESKIDITNITESKIDITNIIESKNDITNITESKNDISNITESKNDISNIIESKNDISNITESKNDITNIIESKNDITNITESKIDITNIIKSKNDIKIKEVESLSNIIDNPNNSLSLLEISKLIKNSEKSEYLINLVNIIKNLILFDIQSNIIYMKHFTLTIVIEEETNKNDPNYLDYLYNELNMFFKNIYKTEPKQFEKNICNIKITYSKI